MRIGVGMSPEAGSRSVAVWTLVFDDDDDDDDDEEAGLEVNK